VKSVLGKMDKQIKNRPRRPLALIGGLIANDNYYSRIVNSAIKRNIPSVSIRKAEASPVVGAALMAIDLLES
jgi:hypothetical protein